MATYGWNPAELGRILAIPATVAEQHLKMAGPLQLKVLLWFALNGTFNAEACAAAVGYQAADCIDAMQYWASAGILQGDGAVVSPAPAPAPAPVPAPAAKKAAPAPKIIKPQMDDVIAARNASPEFAYLLDTVSTRLGKPLSPLDMETLLYLFATAGLPAEVILMAAGYAVSAERFSIRYIEKIALDWADKGICTIAAAEEHLCHLERCQQALLKVQTVCGLVKPLTATAGNMTIAEKWIFDWKVGDDLLQAAARISEEKNGRFEIRYVNRILENWREQGIATAADVNGQSTKTSHRDSDDYEQMVESYIPKYKKKTKG